jgi:hypothetical protein
LKGGAEETRFISGARPNASATPSTWLSKPAMPFVSTQQVVPAGRRLWAGGAPVSVIFVRYPVILLLNRGVFQSK